MPNNMPPMRAARLVLGSACLLLAAALAAGCGDGSDSESTALPEARDRPAPPASEFPGTEGQTLRQVIKSADERAELIVIPAAEVFDTGPNRYPFGILEREGGEVRDADVALYYARVPQPKPGARSKSGNRGQIAKAQAQALDQPAVGPFPASVEALASAPRFRAQSTLEDPNAAGVVYSASLDFPSEGAWRVAAVIVRDGESEAKVLRSAVVGQFSRVPRVGEEAPLIHTPTAQDAGGDLSKITTRVPPDTLNKVDYADALGKEPIVLLFATPKFCQSRVCGPVLDEVQQAQHEYGDKAAFIHMEIFKDNDPAKGPNSQVRDFHLPTEPWLFAIDRRGRVTAAIEGAFGPRVLRRAVEGAIAR
jgi:hypothetical protein